MFSYNAGNQRRRYSVRWIDLLGAFPPAPFGSIRKREQVQTGKQLKKEWWQRRVCQPRWRLARCRRSVHEVGDDGEREKDG